MSQKFTNRGIKSLKNDSLKQRATAYEALLDMTFCCSENDFLLYGKAHEAHSRKKWTGLKLQPI